MNEATRKQNRLDRDRFLSHVDLDDTVGFPAGTVLLTLELGVGYTQTYRLTPDEDGDHAYDRQGILCFRTDEGEHRINLKAGTVAAWHEHTVTEDSPWFNGFVDPETEA